MLFGLNGNDRKVQMLDAANREVVEAMQSADPVLVDVRSAKSVLPELKSPLVLHAGPPLPFEKMTGPAQGALIGVALYEKWASTPEQARAMLERGEIALDSCHHHNAVGPMAGATSGSMPVLVVQDASSGRTAYAILNEGIGAVLRFGAYNDEVQDRLTWFEEEFGPTLSAALRHAGGVPLKPIMSKALLMGDEMHQRNAAASLMFFQALMPHLVATATGDRLLRAVNFLGQTDQFFLNLAMAAGKIIGDAGQAVNGGSIVTAMCRNGVEFGLRVSGLGNSWWTGPVNRPQGMYFAGYGPEDGNPDIGDSAILETIGLGGMALPAAPAVIGFVGSGSFEDAQEIFQRERGIVVGTQPSFQIPTLDGQAALLGIDVRLVVSSGVLPLINTGIAHRVAGIGQIGAGTVSPPLVAFEQAAKALAGTLAP
ncbi:MAG: hypothetical protein C7B45_10500 [Sulfobacillus acidophilus]|uniref:DUF1116 domain-containing protein n=1 Tax=Sulfobacillus acidophilus TaxID=53633 RepID=A0A2T2WH47_9FIRM|nr:MAG: hypothetical protein C7B45_10500 [Sulfobacillus acidophilus]